jgi:hypothetical protein
MKMPVMRQRAILNCSKGKVEKLMLSMIEEHKTKSKQMEQLCFFADEKVPLCKTPHLPI